MIGRFTGAILGLLAFSVSIFAGLLVHNPFSIVLSRAIWALCGFFLIGLGVGTVAQFVVNEFAKQRLRERLPDLAGDAGDHEFAAPDPNSPEEAVGPDAAAPETEPMGT